MKSMKFDATFRQQGWILDGGEKNNIPPPPTHTLSILTKLPCPLQKAKVILQGIHLIFRSHLAPQMGYLTPRVYGGWSPNPVGAFSGVIYKKIKAVAPLCYKEEEIPLQLIFCNFLIKTFSGEEEAMGGGCKTTAMTHLSPGYLCFAHISWLLAFLLLAWELKPTLLQVFLITWEGTSSSSSAPKQSYMLKKRSQHSAPQRPTGMKTACKGSGKDLLFSSRFFTSLRLGIFWHSLVCPWG